jgi:hypothetical protein
MFKKQLKKTKKLGIYNGKRKQARERRERAMEREMKNEI